MAKAVLAVAEANMAALAQEEADRKSTRTGHGGCPRRVRRGPRSLRTTIITIKQGWLEVMMAKTKVMARTKLMARTKMIMMLST